MNIRLKYNKNVYGDMIVKEYSDVNQITHHNDIITIIYDRNRMQNFKVNETLKIEVSIEKE